MQQIDPSYTGAVVPRFYAFQPGPDGEQVGEETGCIRWFYVEPAGSSADGRTTSINSRDADFDWVLTVFYPFVLPYNEMVKLMLQDRRDIRAQLRDPACHRGHADDTTADVGIMSRVCTGDRFNGDVGDPIWSYTSNWRIATREAE